MPVDEDDENRTVAELARLAKRLQQQQQPQSWSLCDDVTDRIITEVLGVSPDSMPNQKIPESLLQPLAGISLAFRRLAYARLTTTRIVLDRAKQATRAMARAAAERIRLSTSLDKLDLFIQGPDLFEEIFGATRDPRLPVLNPRVTSLTFRTLPASAGTDLTTPARLDRLNSAFPALRKLSLTGGTYLNQFRTPTGAKIYQLNCRAPLKEIFFSSDPRVGVDRKLCRLPAVVDLGLVVTDGHVDPDVNMRAKNLLLADIPRRFPNVESLSIDEFEGPQGPVDLEAPREVLRLDPLRSLPRLRRLKVGCSGIKLGQFGMPQLPRQLCLMPALEVADLRVEAGDMPDVGGWLQLPANSLPNLRAIRLDAGPAYDGLGEFMTMAMKHALARAAPKLEFQTFPCGTILIDPVTSWPAAETRLRSLIARDLIGKSIRFRWECGMMQWVAWLWHRRATCAMPSVESIGIEALNWPPQWGPAGVPLHLAQRIEIGATHIRQLIGACPTVTHFWTNDIAIRLASIIAAVATCPQVTVVELRGVAPKTRRDLGMLVRELGTASHNRQRDGVAELTVRVPQSTADVLNARLPDIGQRNIRIVAV